METKAPETIGWREWVSLPELGIPRIKAKIDTGARTSALDAKILNTHSTEDGDFVMFEVTYGTRARPRKRVCESRMLDRRVVTDSGGHTEERIVIETEIGIGKLSRKIELTLSQRQGMKFRMLLGRTALDQGYLVDTSQSYLVSSRKKRLTATPTPDKKQE